MNDEVLDNIKLIYKVMRDLHCNYKNEEEYDEYYCAGVIGLIKGLRKYRGPESKGLFLYMAIKTEIIRIFIKNTTKKRLHKMEYSLNNIIKDDLEYIDTFSSNYDLEKEIVNKVYAEQLLKKLKDRDYKKFIVEYYGIGVPELKMQEIADKYGVSRQYVHQCIHRGLDLIKERIVEEKWER